MIIIDNVLSEEEQIKLELTVLDNQYFPWSYLRSANFGSSEEHEGKIKNPNYDAGKFSNWPNVIDTFSFNHALYVNDRYSNFYPAFMGVIKKLDIKHLIRFKLNITTFDPRYNNDTYGYPHTDMATMNIPEYKTAIYYINDCDGDTFIFNERHQDNFDKFTIKQRVTPKRGRMVVFDGNHYHAGSSPTNHIARAVANINYIPR
jgi:hypothetical protein